jgi:hypothetical protein
MAINKFSNKQMQLKLSLNGQCCYGLSDTGTCINSS